MKEQIIEILKQFEQKDYKRGGVSLAPEMYSAVAESIVKLFAIPDVINSAVYKDGERVEILNTNELGTVWMTNGRWLIVQLDSGERWKGETDQIRHCL